MTNQSFLKLVKYDFLVFFREPFFALPILVLPGIFFFVFMSLFKAQLGTMEGFEVYIPTYALLISFLILFFNIGLQFVTEKERGIHKRLMLSSISKSHIVNAYLTRGVLLSIVGLVEICVIAWAAFDMALSEHFLFFLIGYLLVIGLVLLVSLSVHDLFKNTKQVLPFTIITFQYVMFGSGLMFPAEKAPDFLKALIYSNPFYHMNELLVQLWMGEFSSISMKGILYLAAIALVCVGLVKWNATRKEA